MMDEDWTKPHDNQNKIYGSNYLDTALVKFIFMFLIFHACEVFYFALNWRPGGILNYEILLEVDFVANGMVKT